MRFIWNRQVAPTQLVTTVDTPQVILVPALETPAPELVHEHVKESEVSLEVAPQPRYIKGTIIIIAVYINDSEFSYNELIKCLKQFRHIYAEETIIAVDNRSINNSWYSIANELGIVILHNDSEHHRFEPGAYRHALKHFRADNYIFLQGTFFIKRRLEHTLSSTSMDMVPFLRLDTHRWNEEGLKFIRGLLSKIGFYHEQDDIGVVVACSFCANNLFVNKLLEFGIFDSVYNTKAHSCAFERILDVATGKILGDAFCFRNIPQEYWEKIYLAQDP